MSNHLHLVVRTSAPIPCASSTGRPTLSPTAGRLHPRTGADGNPVAWSEPDLAAHAGDAAWVAKTRTRLRSLSWFMKNIKERLARRADRADRCNGPLHASHVLAIKGRSYRQRDLEATLANRAHHLEIRMH